MGRTSTISGTTMATPTGIAVATRQAASGYALRGLPQRKTYTTSWDINRAGVWVGMGNAYFMARRLDEAEATLRRSLESQAKWPPTFRILASCYAHMGRIDDARAMLDKLRLSRLSSCRRDNAWPGAIRERWSSFFPA